MGQDGGAAQAAESPAVAAIRQVFATAPGLAAAERALVERRAAAEQSMDSAVAAAAAAGGGGTYAQRTIDIMRDIVSSNPRFKKGAEQPSEGTPPASGARGGTGRAASRGARAALDFDSPTPPTGFLYV